MNQREFEYIYHTSILLKKRFTKTQRRKWTNSIFISELLVQLSHLHIAIIRGNTYKYKITDELADIFFNLIIISVIINVPKKRLFNLYEYTKNRAIHYAANASILYTILDMYTISATLLDYSMRIDLFKHANKKRVDMIQDIRREYFVLCKRFFELIFLMNVDINKEMRTMFKDATDFLNLFNS